MIGFALQYMVIDFLEWLNKKVDINFVYTSEVCNGCVVNQWWDSVNKASSEKFLY